MLSSYYYWTMHISYIRMQTYTHTHTHYKKQFIQYAFIYFVRRTLEICMLYFSKGRSGEWYVVVCVCVRAFVLFLHTIILEHECEIANCSASVFILSNQKWQQRTRHIVLDRVYIYTILKHTHIYRESVYMMCVYVRLSLCGRLKPIQTVKSIQCA